MESRSESFLLNMALNESTKSEFAVARKVKQRADLLGIASSEHYWIAEKSLVVDLTINPPWEQGTTSDGNTFYFNHSTGESLWNHPALQKYYELYQKVLSESKPPVLPASSVKQIPTTIVEDEDPNAIESDNSDEDSVESREKSIDDKVAKDLIDKFNEDDVLYWKSQYDELLMEVSNIILTLVWLLHKLVFCRKID